MSQQGAVMIPSNGLKGAKPVVKGAQSQPPDPEVVPKAKHRTFTTAYKLRILSQADRSKKQGQIDSLHVACAIHAGCDYFITTDDRILSKSETISEVVIDDPIGFIKKELP